MLLNHDEEATAKARGQTLPELILEDLRWGPDQAIINHFGESVWLKQMPTYITDCCFTDSPCERHEEK